MATRIRAALGFVAALALAPAAGHASGGGGGGGMTPSMPSDSAPTYDPAQEYQKGQAAFDAGKYKDAAHAFDHVTDAQPTVAAGWYMLGLAKSRAGDARGGASALGRAMKIDPDDVDIRREYALDLVKLKQADKAKAELARLQAQAQACADTCAQAAALKAAVAAVDQALNAPGAETAPKPAASLDAPSSLIFASPAAGDAAYMRAVSLINAHRYEDALASLREAEKVFGPHPDVLTYEGYAWRKLGQYDRARTYYEAALAIAPGHVGALEYYGELKVVRGDLPGARVMLARLDARCVYGCAEVEELRRWIDHGADPNS